jgi:hypothetical protein
VVFEYFRKTGIIGIKHQGTGYSLSGYFGTGYCIGRLLLITAKKGETAGKVKRAKK